jgi:hypothetical protein
LIGRRESPPDVGVDELANAAGSEDASTFDLKLFSRDATVELSFINL